MPKIIVDSGCDLTETMKEKIGIDIESVPLNLQLDDKVFVDDDCLDVEDYLVKMENCPTMAKTSAPSPELFLEKFMGKDSVFAVTISSYLSGSYSSAMLAKDLYLEKLGQKFIHVFDSLSASAGETIIALKINELVKANFSDLEIVENVNKFIDSMKTYFILDKYDTLIKSGRMNPYVAKLASILNIKPICGGIKGKIELVDKARGQSKAFAKLIDLIAKDEKTIDTRVLGITHVKCAERALAFKEEVSKRLNFKEIIIMNATGLCTTYANRGGLIVCY